MADGIEMFRDMSLGVPFGALKGLRIALIEAAVDPWLYHAKRADEIRRNAVTTEDVLLFRRVSTGQLPAASLTLWGRDGGYYVPNIVPLETRSLSFTEYNSILEDFVDRVARPVCDRLEVAIQLSSGSQSLEDWTSEDVATRLRRFSAAANKSTGASHPMDERRWFDFVVASHRSGKEIDVEILARWLREADGWDEETAYSLASYYQNAVALLTYYDEH
ncbi:hypothetical protein SAMN05518849_12655 [Sphingobium sp. AP50]|uniref:hypothetical protein n=1 Tax=Sphingobium sp. AP50 TaxID=1884369 RepID=UPI0008C6C7EB|nr:hypothetical protein [Sphingobium sp. AP50]SEK01174.1 hypothetical protein SAMN05518849_12655 [Sphingobium sp. AP50]